MKRLAFLLASALLLVLLTMSCTGEDPTPTVAPPTTTPDPTPTSIPVATPQFEATVDLISTFDEGADGFMAGFADLPAEYDQALYDLDHGVRALPDGFSGSGFYLQGHNRSDDLFMYIAREVTGLQPNTEYSLDISIEILTNTGANLIGIGGAPGESVFIKAGASSIQPKTIVGDTGHLRMNIDKGNQSTGGADMVVIGNVAHTEVLDREFRSKVLDNSNAPLSVRSDDNGHVWLIAGTDSGFEGFTTLYHDKLSFTLTMMDDSA